MSDRSLRGMRLGAQSMETESGVEPAPRQRVEYRCEDGERVFVTFSSEADIPATWVSKTGKEALLVDGEKPDTSNDKPVRTHWDMLLERRSVEELEQILQDRLTILRELGAWTHPPVVAMLTTFDTNEHISQALSLGAAGFLLKDTEPEHLVHAVRVMAAGGKVLSPKVTDTVITGYLTGSGDGQASARIDTMTPRERDVLALVGQGLGNAQIAGRLHLSPSTVKDHVSAVLTKLAVTNRVQAAIIARDAGLAAGPVPDRR